MGVALCHIIKFEIVADQVANECILVEMPQSILISQWVMLLLHIDTLSTLHKPFQICCRIGLSPPTCETNGWVFSILKKTFHIFYRMRQPLVCENESLAFWLPKFCCKMRQHPVYENKPLTFSKRLPIFATEWALASSMWDNRMSLILPSLGVDTPSCGSCILQ